MDQYLSRISLYIDFLRRLSLLVSFCDNFIVEVPLNTNEMKFLLIGILSYSLLEVDETESDIEIFFDSARSLNSRIFSISTLILTHLPHAHPDAVEMTNSKVSKPYITFII